MKKYFEFDKLGTNYRKETLGGLTTFLSMAYILAVNPGMLSAAGMDYNAVFVATALAAAVGSLFMGLIARYPIALAPGMGLNAFFAFSVVLGMGMAWETALTGVLFSGLIFIILSLTGLRETIINAIPAQLKYAVGAGIGLFITFVGFQGSGIIVGDEATLVKLGDVTSGNALLAVFGVVITAIFMAKKINGGIFYGMVITAIAGMIFGLVNVPEKVFSGIPDVSPTFGAAFAAFADLGLIFNMDFLIVVLTFLFVDFFDTAGTLMAVAGQAGLVKDNKLPRAGRALLADALATVTGAIFGTSTTTSYVESTAGVAAGARTGFASVVTGILFLLALFISPLLAVVTSAVTAPALIIVGALMVSSLRLIEWDKIEIAIPAFLVILCMPLGYSIATGIAIGFLFYPITMIVAGRSKEVHPIMYGMFLIFLGYFIFL
ncbi:NCS2 family permease [Solibacillus sp. FSL K6-1523]|uniref:NCS2 family permease n=1 Tax=Solibacillus sp. FSL K6-1523 TaxID=2921471 RepID=UPI0030FD0330